MTSKRVTLVASELRGYTLTGGIATTVTHLALALARMGNDVQVVYTGDSDAQSLDPEWAQTYDDAGVNIRRLPRCGGSVEPSCFALMRDVQLALRDDPPDVVISEDLGASSYVALRLRSLGLGFESTLFVVLVHGTRRWITDVARKVRVLPGAHAITVLEQASLELADVVVSPSTYALEWMRGQGWRLPDTTLVIPHLTRSEATGVSAPIPPEAQGARDGRVRRIAFFGRLEERKGLVPFIVGLNALRPDLLEGVELEFVGKATRAWPPSRVEALLSEQTKRALRRVSFETRLDQRGALARLSRPGTLTVMPSFAETYGNAVRECLEHRIPFLASNAGAVPELIAPEDQERVLFEPTAEGVGQALTRALSGSGDVLLPARPAEDGQSTAERWADVLALPPRGATASTREDPIDVIVVHRSSREALSRCMASLAAQTYQRVSIVLVIGEAAGDTLSASDFVPPPLIVRSEAASVEAMRATAVRASTAPWIVFLNEDDVAEPRLVETLVRAQVASNADAVSCAVYRPDDDGRTTLRFFAGEPRGLGALSNGYGTVALLRRTLVTDVTASWPSSEDADWPLLAGLSVAGANVVSVPIPLVTRRRLPGDVHSTPTAALRVAQQFESALPDTFASLARLAAGLAAEAARAQTPVRRGRLRRNAARLLRRRS